MRLTALSCLVALGASCGFASAASAGPKVLVRTQTYDIVGNTGAELLEAMDRKGPKHGFMTRAIAQTAYAVDWKLKVSQANGVCRLLRADRTLTLTYTYPRVSSRITPRLEKRWRRFFVGVRAHEEMHGRMARQMVKVAERSVVGLEVADDHRCNSTRREARRRIDAVYAQYEKRQVAFDKREHGSGGKVEGLVKLLLGRH